MSAVQSTLLSGFQRVGARWMPFADAASPELPLANLLRLSLFQVSTGMAIVLLTGTLNRVMIVELQVPAAVVATMVGLPLLLAPFRALIGHRSDNHASYLGWRRVPYLWFGSLLQFGGLAIMPFALIVLSGDHNGPAWAGPVGAGLAFLMTGAGMHMAQTAGLALATDLAPAESRPRVVALLYVMLLVGMVASALLFGWLLAEFSQIRLIRVIQGAAAATMVLNFIALWKQEPRNPQATRHDIIRPTFSQSWQAFIADRRSARLLVAVGLGTAGFSMQDVLLEPYGGQILLLSVSATTVLTALMAAGGLVGLAAAARLLGRGVDAYRLAAFGALIGTFAFAAIVLAAPFASPTLFRIGAAIIGLGGGLFAVGTLTAAMELAEGGESGLALGAWGAVQATAMGGAMAMGGVLRDLVGGLAMSGRLGVALETPVTGYGVVYIVEIVILFAAIVAIGPLAGQSGTRKLHAPGRFGLAQMPG